MTKKDYILIALALNEELTYATNLRQGKIDVGMQDVSSFTAQVNGVKGVIGTLCQALALDNPKFDRSKFLKACGIELPAFVNNKGKTVNY